MQKTSYEMRISDWSSDVCSSDLDLANGIDPPFTAIDADPLTGSKRGTQQRRAMHGVLAQGVSAIKHDLYVTCLHTQNGAKAQFGFGAAIPALTGNKAFVGGYCP